MIQFEYQQHEIWVDQTNKSKILFLLVNDVPSSTVQNSFSHLEKEILYTEISMVERLLGTDTLMVTPTIPIKFDIAQAEGCDGVAIVINKEYYECQWMSPAVAKLVNAEIKFHRTKHWLGIFDPNLNAYGAIVVVDGLDSKECSGEIIWLSKYEQFPGINCELKTFTHKGREYNIPQYKVSFKERGE